MNSEQQQPIKGPISMSVGSEPTNMRPRDFFKSIREDWANEPETEHEETEWVLKKYKCPECQIVRDDEDGQNVVKGNKEIFTLICPICEDKIKKQKRLDEYFADVPTIYRGEMKFDRNPLLLTSKASVIFGNYGTGKTWTAYSIAKELFLSYKINKFKVAREIQIINEVRENSYKTQHYIDLDLLVIDEFGKINDTDFTKAQIFNIIDSRFEWDRQTILICNASNDKEVRQILPEAIQDRYKKCVVFMGGESRR